MNGLLAKLIVRFLNVWKPFKHVLRCAECITLANCQLRARECRHTVAIRLCSMLQKLCALPVSHHRADRPLLNKQ